MGSVSIRPTRVVMYSRINSNRETSWINTLVTVSAMGADNSSEAPLEVKEEEMEDRLRLSSCCGLDGSASSFGDGVLAIGEAHKRPRDGWPLKSSVRINKKS